MRLIDNEDGVSELVGFMLILLIIMIFMSVLQVYQVPKWNKDLEIGLFDDVRNDFLEIRHDISTAAIENTPITSNLQMGVRYPEHFMLRNPGPGASGTLTFEPVNVNLTIGSSKQNYTSYRIKYKMNGISNQPELIYEHGLIISDFGSVQLNESSQSIVEGNRIFLPLIFSQFQSISGMTPESLNIMPVSIDNYNVKSDPSSINILLETNYPDMWNNTIKNVPGVNLTNISGKWYINITKTVSTFMYPPDISATYGGLYSGRITTELPESEKTSSGGTGGVPSGGTGAQGAYSNEAQSTNRINIPSSSEIQKFVIDNIQVTDLIASNNRGFMFFITDKEGDKFNVEVTFNNNITIEFVYINGTKIKEFNDQPISNGIDLTSYYISASISKPNSLVFRLWESAQSGTANRGNDILSIRLLICDIARPC